ncbi:MAG: acetyltransferase [Bacteroidales bacterium]|nr:acetyltransferase [Bacteroidales bacterium]
MSLRYHIDIPLSTVIGYGLYIGHPRCIVINSGTKIGNNVNLSQCLSIGTNENTPAVIGNNVYIGPMVSIVEVVRIGGDATIGASNPATRGLKLLLTFIV